MRRSVISLGLLLTASAPVLAQATDTLRDGLNHVPATVFAQSHGDIAYFVDVATLANLVSDEGDAGPFQRVLSGADIIALQSLSMAEPNEWEAKAGTRIDSLLYFIGYGRAPDSQTHWGLVDAAAASDLVDTLKASGFAEAGPTGVVGNGEPRRFDPSLRDPEDPWRTSVGAAQFAAASGTNVVQAQTPQAAALAASAQPSLGESAIMQTALAGLDHVIGDGVVAQAVVISPLFGMAGLDPAAFLSPQGNIEETRRQFEAQIAELGSGIPPYLGGIVADLDDDRQGVAIALAYPDCDLAQQAVDTLSERWSTMTGEEAQGETMVDRVEGVDGLCAASFSVFVEGEGQVQNPAYRAVLDTYFRQQAGVLNIGKS
ncbi:hypothetical protein [Devosia chinhatensis]|uniref:Uncharacterized protein n=1 Tax=Devosia chinhatensis TaxID=429727 RepID=A0A0F5FIF2_9HYPH|nr:hypothetical protein [Devosia chinhatensis]KKB08664.1 hypothetical protein VE26_00800 [Devosia chinhatensis]